jgi:hypothetical protein
MSYKKVEENFQKFKGYLRNKLGFSKHQEKIHDKETLEKFNKLSSDKQLELIKPQMEFFTSAVSRKTEILPTLATLAAALIVVSTLNNSLVPLSSIDTKIILTIFLLLIPITLHYYIKVMEETANRAVAIIASYMGKNPFVDIKISFIDQFGADFPIIIVYIFYGVVFFVLFRMWFN